MGRVPPEALATTVPEANRCANELEGESHEVGTVHAALARAVARRSQPFEAPCVIFSGDETTVSLGK